MPHEPKSIPDKPPARESRNAESLIAKLTRTSKKIENAITTIPVVILSTAIGTASPKKIPKGNSIAAKTHIRYKLGMSSLLTFHWVESQRPPSSSADITMGIKKGTGKNHISSGDIMSAPPNPLRRRIKPPKMAEKNKIPIKSGSTALT